MPSHLESKSSTFDAMFSDVRPILSMMSEGDPLSPNLSLTPSYASSLAPPPQAPRRRRIRVLQSRSGPLPSRSHRSLRSDGPPVDWLDGVHVDDRGLDAPLSQPICCLEGSLDHDATGDDRRIGTLSNDGCLSRSPGLGLFLRVDLSVLFLAVLV